MKIITHYILLIASLFAALPAFAVVPDLSVYPTESSLEISVDSEVKEVSANVEFAKIGKINTATILDNPDRGIAIKAPEPGLNNITLCGAAKISGQNGVIRIIEYGAGNLITLGYRLGAQVTDGEYKLQLLMVGSPEVTRKDGLNNFCIINSKKTFPCGDWIFFAVVMNRTGKAEMFVNGEPVASESIQILEKDDMSIGARTYISTHEDSGDISMEFAGIEVYYTLLSSVEIEKISLKTKGLPF